METKELLKKYEKTSTEIIVGQVRKQQKWIQKIKTLKSDKLYKELGEILKEKRQETRDNKKRRDLIDEIKNIWEDIVKIYVLYQIEK